MRVLRCAPTAFIVIACALLGAQLSAEDVPNLPKATIDGTGPGWKELTLADFQMVNGDEDTWTTTDGVIHCTGQPVGPWQKGVPQSMQRAACLRTSRSSSGSVNSRKCRMRSQAS